MFKVLVISYYFPPKGLSGVQRTLKFVKYMPQNGWSPTVLTSGDIAYYAYDDKLNKDLADPAISVVRVNGKEINSLLGKRKIVSIPPEWFRKVLKFFSSLFYIPDNKWSWGKAAFKEALKLLEKEKFDLIFVTGPPFSSVPFAVKLKKKFNIPLVVDYRDLWFGNHFAVYPTPLHRVLIKSMEYAALKDVNKITVTNRRIKEKLKEVYPFLKFDDILIVPHGFDVEDIEKASGYPKLTKKMVIMYSGIFYEYITPKYFLLAFKKLVKERPEIASDIELHFAGFFRKENHRLVRKLNLQNWVVDYGYLSHDDALKKVMAADLLWFMVGKGKNADTISSSKLFEYFGTKKPVLASLPEGALKMYAREYAASYITDPDNTEEIKDALIKAYNDYKNGTLPVPADDYVEKFRRDDLTKKLLVEFQFLLKVKE